MVGDVVGGYVVKEALASGRSGLLFLAVHAETGHRAVVQRRLGEDAVRQFAREAAQILALEGEPHVERRRSRAGLPVLLAVVDADAPGSGYTEHTNTERLPDLPRPAAPWRRWRYAMPALVLLGGALGALLMKATARQTVTTNAVAVQTARVPPVEKVPEVVQEPPPPSGADASLLAANAPPVKGPEASRAVRPKAAIAEVADEPSYCEADVDWKFGARADLIELLQRAAKHDELVLWAAGEDQAISQGIAAATTRAHCKAVEQRIHRLHQRVLALERVAQPASP